MQGVYKSECYRKREEEKRKKGERSEGGVEQTLE